MITASKLDTKIDDNTRMATLSTAVSLKKVIPPIQPKRVPKKLQMTDSLVAPVEKTDVPNHVLNTKIYAKLHRNEVFEVTPTEVHFAGYEINKKFTQKLKIINISGQVERLTVLPPKQVKHFDIHYIKPERLVPGFALEVDVIFKPDEYKYYTDAIRIFSEGEECLFVPIHAYPIVSPYEFPTKYNFPNLPIGKSLTRNFKMRSTAPIEFEYMIEIIQRHPAFRIEPTEGVIPYNRDAVISVTFSPTEFCTATMTIQLVVSQFNSKPIVCSFYGTSTPGLARDMLLNQLAKEPLLKRETSLTQEQANGNDTILDPRMISPLYVARSKRAKANVRFNNDTKNDENKDVVPKQDPFVDFDGYRFPKNLNNPWAISKVLIQKKDKLSMKEIKSTQKSPTSMKISAQVKEALFIQKVTELEDEERRNQLKWQVKLGESLVDEETRQDILRSRANAEYEYKLSIGVPFLEQEIQRFQTSHSECRTIRMYNELPRTDIKFDMFKNQTWKVRYMSIEAFIQGARKIIIKRRLEKVLNLLRKFISSWNEALNEQNESGEEGKLNIDNFVEIYAKRLSGQSLNQNEELKQISLKSIGTYYFPSVSEFKEFQNQKVRHYEKLNSISKLDSLGPVAVKSIDFHLKAQIPFVNLAVPVCYKLNNYKQMDENNYVPIHEKRLMSLRKGAEDELTQIDTSLIKTNKTETKVKIKEEAKPVKESTKIIDLVPLKQLSEPCDYSPMHIFNPAPGLVSYHRMLPYSGVDLNHHLNPLPRFERSDQAFTTQKRFLDREDVIKGIMLWKKFPSQGLVSLSNTPTLTDVWVPRWSDTFGDDLMPFETPDLLSGLPADDKENLLDEPSDSDGILESNREKIYLTPEMANAQFNIPDIFELREKTIRDEALRQQQRQILYRITPELQFPHGEKLPATNLPVSSFGQVPRDQRQQELEFFLNKQYNSIGLKLQQKLISVEKILIATTPLHPRSAASDNNDSKNS